MKKQRKKKSSSKKIVRRNHVAVKHDEITQSLNRIVDVFEKKQQASSQEDIGADETTKVNYVKTQPDKSFIRLSDRMWNDFLYHYSDLDVSQANPIDERHRVVFAGFSYLDIAKFSSEALGCLLNMRLNRTEKASVISALFGTNVDAESLLDKKCSSVKEMSYIIQAMYQHDTLKYNVEVKLASRWYPVKLNYSFYQSFFGDILSFSARLQLAEGAETVDVRYRVYSDSFIDNVGDIKLISVRDVMTAAGMKPLTESDQLKFLAKAMRARSFGTKYGKQVVISGDVIAKNEFSFFGPSIEEIRFGSKSQPRRAIVEPQLELQQIDEHDEMNSVVLPLVRVFSMDLKRYVYADVDDIEEYKPDGAALDKLVLPSNIKGLVKGLFEAHVDKLFGDVMDFKHGGMIICAAGPTGVGKTLTAECFAEHTHRPLYSVELGELGTTVDKLEEKLRIIFSRAKRWNAVLLLDEADVMFQKRDDANLERAAIVGVFLRLLDYYSGFLFLTTNRPETLDPAFESRITLTVNYPDLTPAARAKIWTNMLAAAGVKSPVAIERLAEWQINGRRIRSMVRLLKTIHGDAPTWAQIETMFNNIIGTTAETISASTTNGKHMKGSYSGGLS